MSIEAEAVWMDGVIVPFADAKVHVLTHTLHYGLGVFEGIRAYEQPDGKAGIWRLDEHLRRFADSLKMIQYTSPYTHEQLVAACHDVLAANRFREAYLRPLAFLGHEALGIGARNNTVHVTVAAWQWGRYLGEEGVKKGIRAKTSSFVRHHPNAAMQRAKVVGHYVNSILARYEANDAGFDEALLLDSNGYVAEGTGENVFVVRDGVAWTPPLMNVLPGVTRKTVIEILQHEGIEVREQQFGRDGVYAADEAFFCGTAAEVTPIRELDWRSIGDGTPGPVTQKVQATYAAAVRGRVDWLAAGINRL